MVGCGCRDSPLLLSHSLAVTLTSSPLPYLPNFARLYCSDTSRKLISRFSPVCPLSPRGPSRVELFFFPFIVCQPSHSRPSFFHFNLSQEDLCRAPPRSFPHLVQFSLRPVRHRSHLRNHPSFPPDFTHHSNHSFLLLFHLYSPSPSAAIFLASIFISLYLHSFF